MMQREPIELSSNDGLCTFHDITGETRAIVGRSGIANRDRVDLPTRGGSISARRPDVPPVQGRRGRALRRQGK